jgi:hypothetical protein
MIKMPGDATVEVRHADPLLTIDAVIVLAELTENPPPAVAPPVVSFLNSPLPKFKSVFIVIVKLFDNNISPDAKVTAAAVPDGVVAQTSAALMLPDFRAK